MHLPEFQFPFTKGKLNVRETLTVNLQQIQFETSTPSEQLKAQVLGHSYRSDYVYVFIMNETNP